MESFVQNIANVFGLKCENITKEKFGYKCNIAGGENAAKIQKLAYTQTNINNILFQHEIKTCLMREGFSNIDSFFVTETGLPYHRQGGDIFTISQSPKCKEKADFTKKDDFLKIIKHVADMHVFLKNINLGSFVPSQRKAITEPSKAISFLAAQKKRLLKGGKFSEFDMLFLKSYDIFVSQITSFEALDKSVLDKDIYICHNLLKEENIYIDSEHKPFFKNFSNTSQRHYFYDLTYLIKRLLKVSNGAEMPLDEVLQEYEKANPAEAFDEDTKNFFMTLLLYPDKFIKLSLDYYNKKRNFTPKSYLRRMEECIERNQTLLGYLGFGAC